MVLALLVSCTGVPRTDWTLQLAGERIRSGIERVLGLAGGDGMVALADLEIDAGAIDYPLGDLDREGSYLDVVRLLGSGLLHDDGGQACASE